MRRTTGTLLAGSVLLGLLAGCGGSDTPAGTLSMDQVTGAESVKDRDGISNQVTCQDIDDAEDKLVDAQPYDKDQVLPSVSFDLTGDSLDHEFVDNSVWPVSDPQLGVRTISAGIDACVEQYPENYERIDSIKDHPEAVGYTQTGGNTFLRRLIVPLEDRVVIVGVLREGSDDFMAKPDDLLGDAVSAAPDAEVD